MSMHASFGGVVDDARTRWEEADKAAREAFAFATSGTAPDPVEASRRSNALSAIAERLHQQFEMAAAASEEARLHPIRSIDLKKIRTAREEAANPPGLLRKLGTIAILASPLAISVWFARGRR